VPGSSSLRLHTVISSLTWGGAETLLADFAEGAAARGIEVSVAYLRDDAHVAGRLRRLGIDPVPVPISSLLSRGDHRRVESQIAAVGPDVVHTHLGNADLVGGYAARRLGIPSVASVHLISERSTGLRERFKAGLFAYARRHCAARVITVSEAARRSYLEMGWDRPERVLAVHNGIVDRASPGAGARVRAELGIGPEDPVIAMIAVLRRDKRHALAIEATRRLRVRYPNLRLLILGDGPDRRLVEDAARDLERAVVMTGHRDDVMEVLDAVDVLVHPSVRDAFPTTLLEAACARVPAVATAVDGIPEIIDDRRDGVLLSSPPTVEALEDALDELLADPSLRAELAAAARQRFERQFTAEAWLDRLVPVYETALAEAG
jgi:glycosyltransferase involved in cell wall biosynthesis